MRSPTIQDARPHICGLCEAPIRPHRWVAGKDHGRQCNCPRPTSPVPVPDDSLCFVVKDAVELEAPKRIDREPLDRACDSIQRMRLELGTTPTELAGERIVEAREDLREAMKIADRHRETDPFASDLHRRTCELVSDIDDFLAYIADRSGA